MILALAIAFAPVATQIGKQFSQQLRLIAKSLTASLMNTLSAQRAHLAKQPKSSEQLEISEHARQTTAPAAP